MLSKANEAVLTFCFYVIELLRGVLVTAATLLSNWSNYR